MCVPPCPVRPPGAGTGQTSGSCGSSPPWVEDRASLERTEPSLLPDAQNSYTKTHTVSLVGLNAAPDNGSPAGPISPLVNLFFYRLGTESSDLEVDTAGLQGDGRFVSSFLISGNLPSHPTRMRPARNRSVGLGFFFLML